MNFEDIIELRKEFHQIAEVSEKEERTSRKVLEELKRFQPSEIRSGIGGYGIIATFDSGNPGPSRLFRAELDALPIQEVNSFDHKSKTDGVSHKCGHDGHLSTLLGLAKMITEHPFETGKVHLLFQPAEENGVGAEAVIQDEQFAGVNPDYVFAYHNLPGYELGNIVVKEGSFTTSVKSLILKFQGVTAHASEPEHGINPSLAISKVLQEVLALENNQLDHPNFNVITPIHISVGTEDYGISAGSGELHLTIRTWTQEDLELLDDKIRKIASELSQAHELELSIESLQEFQANKCHPEAVELIRKAAKENNFNLQERDYPFKWGEDFGVFTQAFKGAMFGIGSGVDSPALHNPDYDFPDGLISVGAQLFYQLISLTEK